MSRRTHPFVSRRTCSFASEAILFCVDQVLSSADQALVCNLEAAEEEHPYLVEVVEGLIPILGEAEEVLSSSL